MSCFLHCYLGWVTSLSAERWPCGESDFPALSKGTAPAYAKLPEGCSDWLIQSSPSPLGGGLLFSNVTNHWERSVALSPARGGYFSGQFHDGASRNCHKCFPCTVGNRSVKLSPKQHLRGWGERGACHEFKASPELRSEFQANARHKIRPCVSKQNS